MRFECLLLVGAVLPVQALAQEGPASEASARSPTGIEDIVVTATRREQSLQSVPIAVTAVTGEALEKSGVKSVMDLGQVVPSLVMGRSTSLAQPSLRGVQTSLGEPGNESPIAIYIDGIYQAEPTGNTFSLVDVERIEVLRGPQGTLYGRNSTGGLINVITRDPKFDTGGSASLTVGNFGRVSLSGYGTTGLTDKIAASLGATYGRDRGYVSDLVRGGTTGESHDLTIRGKLLFEPSDATKFVVTLGFVDNSDPAAVSPQLINGNSVGYGAVPTAPRAFADYQYAGGMKPQNDMRQYAASLRGSVDLGGANLESTTAYQHTVSNVDFDSDATISTIRDITFDRKNDYLSQEFRLLSQGDRPLQYIVGVFGIYGRNVQRIVTNQTTGAFLDSRAHTYSVAPFLEVNYRVTDTLKLTGGLRWTYERRDFTPSPNGIAQPEARKSYRNFSPRVTVEYHPVDHAMVYATYSQGFKSGVFNTQSTNRIPVNPEKLKNYEVGLKTDPLRWLRINLTAYRYSYDDIQVAVRDAAGVNRLLNAASARIKGIDGELVIRPLQGFTVNVAGSYLDATYGTFPNALVTIPLPSGNGNSQVVRDVSGNRLNRAPKYTVNLGANYVTDILGHKVEASANIYRTARIYYDFDNRFFQPAYTKINGQISFDLNPDFNIMLWGRNLTNRKIVNNMSSAATSDYVTWELPRTYGVTLSGKF